MVAEHSRYELKMDEDAYPSFLRECPDPPATLYCVGDLSLLKPGLAIIGTRRATPYGVTAARRFATFAAARGVTIISGAAIGCDQAAQRAAIATGGRSVAVLGCGVDVDYPSNASDLLDELRRSHLVVSEMPWGAKPTRYSFVRRNRIIAAMAAVLLVTEAGTRSGTFSTADAALGMGRDVLAVPGSILSPESAGANRLIRQGAAPVTEAADLHDALVAAGLIDTDRASEANAIVVPASSIERAIAASPMRPDDLARELDLDIVTAVRRLSELELLGRVVRHHDGRYFLAPSRSAPTR